MKKTVIKFWAQWCGPCNMFKPTFERAMNELQSDQIDFIDVNIDDDPNNLKVKYEIKSIPTTIILDENHNILRKKTGGMRLQELKDLILE